MRTHITVAFSLLTGIGIGAIAVQGLHAQSKPLVYLINEIDVTDPESTGPSSPRRLRQASEAPALVFS